MKGSRPRGYVLMWPLASNEIFFSSLVGPLSRRSHKSLSRSHRPRGGSCPAAGLDAPSGAPLVGAGVGKGLTHVVPTSERAVGAARVGFLGRGRGHRGRDRLHARGSWS